MSSIVIDPDKCTVCGDCAKVCVSQIIDDSDDEIKLRLPETCIFCGHCKAVCPVDAIEIPSLNEKEFVEVAEKEDCVSPEKLQAFFRKRRSIRIYKDKPVEKEKITQIIEAGRFAPTGGNVQALRYAVAHTPEKMNEIKRMAIDSLLEFANAMSAVDSNQLKDDPKAALSDLIRQSYAQSFKDMADRYEQGTDNLLWNAPALIVTHVSKVMESPGVDVALLAMQMVLMAEAMGLGTCFIGMIPMAVENSPELKKLMLIPENHRTITAFVAGHPDVTYLRLVSRKTARIRWL